MRKDVRLFNSLNKLWNEKIVDKSRRRLLAGFAAITAVGGIGYYVRYSTPIIGLRQGLMAGEVTQDSVILQARLTNFDTEVALAGVEGVLQFEISENADFSNAKKSSILKSSPRHDNIVKFWLDGLSSGTNYFYRALYGASDVDEHISEAGNFRTLQGASGKKSASFCVFSCLGYEQFYFTPVDDTKIYDGPDAELGYPGMAAMAALQPDFAVGTGDIVYYDQLARPWAKTLDQMRALWQEQAILPNMKLMCSQTAIYWQKDDHDYRFNDADPEDEGVPSHELGRDTFIEQLPFPTAEQSPPYRTYRVSRDLQIWLPEGRDFRSPNEMPDGPEKTLWGVEQRNWLMNSLKESEAKHRVVINTTPIIGPDYKSKSDNHVNPDGFRTEGQMFLDFLKEEDLLETVTLICGDRHWPYHSVSPQGVHEICAGTATEGNEVSNAPRPGDEISTDPDGTINQIWARPEPTASFVHAKISESSSDLELSIVSSTGSNLYSLKRLG